MPPRTRSRLAAFKHEGGLSEAPAGTPNAKDKVVDNQSSSNSRSESPTEGSQDGSQSPSHAPPATPALSSKQLRMSYVIGPGETGVLTFEPYKSLLLPLWRFRTVPIARKSSSDLYAAFTHYLEAGDFVGADMARKFLQMGMTRAGRYANYKGGKKYEQSGEQKEKSAGHAGREEKLNVKEVFRAVWERAKEDGRYAKLREDWRTEKKVWEKGAKERETDD